MPDAFTFEAAVEGDLDEAVLRRSALHLGMELGNVYGRQGKSNLESSVGGYNKAAEHWPWTVLVDLDESHACPGELRSDWLPEEAPFMCLRVAVRQVESWLLADIGNTASLLGVKRSFFPADPDGEQDAKRTLVELAAKSSRENIREALLPPPGAKRKVGPLYNATLRAFVADRWNPDEAASRSESFCRCLGALEALRAKWTATQEASS
jgi:hypothetical protein